MANAGSLVTTIQDMSDTGPDGYRFLKLDCGMDGILRPGLYARSAPDDRRQRQCAIKGICGGGPLL